MPQYLVGSLTAERWYLYPEIDWLGPTDALADALRDLRPDRGVLSVFEIEDTATTEHIHRVVAAIAAKGKEEPVDVTYRLFHSGLVPPLGVHVNSRSGETGDVEVNRLHRNVEFLSADKLGRLATIMAHGTGGELLSKRFVQIVRRKVNAGRLRLHGVHGKLRESLGLG